MERSVMPFYVIFYIITASCRFSSGINAAPTFPLPNAPQALFRFIKVLTCPFVVVANLYIAKVYVRSGTRLRVLPFDAFQPSLAGCKASKPITSAFISSETKRQNRLPRLLFPLKLCPRVRTRT